MCLWKYEANVPYEKCNQTLTVLVVLFKYYMDKAMKKIKRKMIEKRKCWMKLWM